MSMPMKNDYTIHDGTGTAVIKLTQGRAMLVAEADLKLLAQHRWYARRHGHTFYAMTAARHPDGRRTTLAAHRLLTGLEFGDPREVDHQDGDGLNNHPSNLRVTNSTGNQHNHHGKRRRRRDIEPTSAHPGVCWNKTASKWVAKINFASRSIHLGYWDTELAAAEAYARAKSVRDSGGTITEIQAARRAIATVEKRR
jgi:hypothetical protein